MPCLNEADTLATCIRKALARDARGRHRRRSHRRRQRQHRRLAGDRARETGARVVPVADKGYGNALMGGIARRARAVRHHGRRRRQLRLRSRSPQVRRRSCARATTSSRAAACPSGGGTRAARRDAAACTAGAATRCSRAWPAAGSARRSTTSTAACAASRKTLYERLDQRCTGMEFATEMIIKASLRRRADRRGADHAAPRRPQDAHPPHLQTFRDGWRTLRFFLMYSPRWLFLVPGLLLIVLGLAGYIAGDAAADDRPDDVRRAHAAVRQPGRDLRLPVHALRRLRQDVRDRPRVLLPRGSAGGAVLAAVAARAGTARSDSGLRSSAA